MWQIGRPVGFAVCKACRFPGSASNTQKTCRVLAHCTSCMCCTKPSCLAECRHDCKARSLQNRFNAQDLQADGPRHQSALCSEAPEQHAQQLQAPLQVEEQSQSQALRKVSQRGDQQTALSKMLQRGGQQTASTAAQGRHAALLPKPLANQSPNHAACSTEGAGQCQDDLANCRAHSKRELRGAKAVRERGLRSQGADERGEGGSLQTAPCSACKQQHAPPMQLSLLRCQSEQTAVNVNLSVHS